MFTSMLGALSIVTSVSNQESSRHGLTPTSVEPFQFRRDLPKLFRFPELQQVKKLNATPARPLSTDRCLGRFPDVLGPKPNSLRPNSKTYHWRTSNRKVIWAHSQRRAFKSGCPKHDRLWTELKKRGSCSIFTKSWRVPSFRRRDEEEERVGWVVVPRVPLAVGCIVPLALLRRIHFSLVSRNEWSVHVFYLLLSTGYYYRDFQHLQLWIHKHRLPNSQNVNALGEMSPGHVSDT